MTGKIKLPHASGNSMSIAAPATNPASDLELKLPATIGSANQLVKNSGTAGTLEFSSNLTFDGNLITGTHSSGNVGLELHATGSGIGNQTKYHNDHGEAYIGQAGDTSGQLIIHNSSDTATTFSTNNTERMRIASGGDVLIGTTSATAGLGVLQVQEGGNGTGINGRCSSGSYTSTVIHAQCDRNTTNATYNFFAGVCTSVQTRFLVADSGNVTNTNGTYGQISDSRLKENIEDASSQWNDIKALKFRKFNFTEASGSPTHKQLGLVAQEAETVCPNLIEDQNIEIKGVKGDYKTIKSSVLYMKGMKALQEAMAKIETLEAKVAALEAG